MDKPSTDYRHFRVDWLAAGGMLITKRRPGCLPTGNAFRVAITRRGVTISGDYGQTGSYEEATELAEVLLLGMDEYRQLKGG